MAVDSGATPVRRRNPTASDLRGRRIGDAYVLVDVIGRGATGTVWRALDQVSGDEVAVKLLRPDLVGQPKVVTRFVQEREIQLRLRHDNIVRVRELLTVDDSLGLVMDLVAGGSLRDYLLQWSTLSSHEAAGLLAQVASALAAAHAIGVVHRDLKPDNVLLDWSDGMKVRLTDFGIARVLDSPNLTTHEALIGTPNYMAPELINGARPTPAVDVYSLGVLLYELVVGRQPYAGGAAIAVLRRHLDEVPSRPPGLPDPVWSVIEVCLDKDPGRRPPAEELVTTLRSLAHLTAGIPAMPPSPFDDEAPATPIRSWAYLGRKTPDSPGEPGTSRRRRFGTTLAATGVMLLPGVSDAPGMGLLDFSHHRRPGVSSALPISAPPPMVSPRPPAPSGSPGSARPSTAVPPRVPLFGPWVCTDREDSWNGVLSIRARPCHAIGLIIRLSGRLTVLSVPKTTLKTTLKTNLTIWLEDTARHPVAGPFRCTGVSMPQSAEQTCGPFDVTVPPGRGRQYVVVEKWVLSWRNTHQEGVERGTPFTWPAAGPDQNGASSGIRNTSVRWASSSPGSNRQAPTTCQKSPVIEPLTL